MSGFCHGREEGLETFRMGLEQRREIDALEFTRGGDHVVLGARGPSMTEVGGEPLGGQIFNVFTLRNGRIMRIDDYRGRAEVACGSRRRQGCGLELIASRPPDNGLLAAAGLEVEFYKRQFRPGRRTEPMPRRSHSPTPAAS